MTPLTDLEGAHFWASVIVYAFQKAAREHRLSMALEYSNNVDGVVADALAEAHYPGCVGTCLLAVVMETRHLIQLSEATGPVIAVECDPEEPLIPSLCFDNVGAGRIVAEHLLKLGHRRIAYVNYPSALSSHGDRLRAIEGSLHRAGLDLTATVTYTSEHPETVRNLLDGPDRPTAIISGSHFIAQVLMELVAGSGRRVPEDLSIVTFYGGQLDTGHRITMAEMDHRTLGRHALEMLLDEDLPDSPRRVLIPVGLSEAGTTAPPAR